MSVYDIPHLSPICDNFHFRCNFTNNAATIGIFVKGLKNAHTLAACVYEKGPQTLTDTTISEVEKLQAAQQLTTTLLPSLAVNVMTNVFSVRSRVTLHIIALMYTVLNAMSMFT